MKVYALRVRALACVALFILAAAVSASAQSGSSGVRGTVSDSQGAHIPGATVTLTSEATGYTRSVVSDASGDYQFVAVPPGTYTVKVELQGFSQGVYKGVVLPVDIIAKQDVRLEVGQLSESVQVHAETTGHQHDRRQPRQRHQSAPDAGAAARGAQRRRPAQPAARRGLIPPQPRHARHRATAR